MELNLEAPPKDKNEVFFSLNPGLTITLRELDPGFYFFSPLVTVPSKRRAEIFQLAMQANLLGQGTGGAVLGMDEGEKFLTLTLTLAYDMNYKEFRDALSDFANYVDYWKEELKRKELE